QNFVLWLAAAVGSLGSEMFYSEDVFLATFFAWFVTSVLGGLLIQFGPREEEEEEEEPAAPSKVEPAQAGQPQVGHPQVTPPQITPPQES
ncbi:MAG: hypothetical protein OXF01_09315, partial [Gemmatimonadetes bacterium]|nr:hypothetical protein [Gemmatimonadota bacterium]